MTRSTSHFSSAWSGSLFAHCLGTDGSCSSRASSSIQWLPARLAARSGTDPDQFCLSISGHARPEMALCRSGDQLWMPRLLQISGFSPRHRRIRLFLGRPCHSARNIVLRFPALGFSDRFKSRPCRTVCVVAALCAVQDVLRPTCCWPDHALAAIRTAGPSAL